MKAKKQELKLIEVNGEELTTTSLVIAEEFGRRHQHVIRSLKRLEERKKISPLAGLSFLFKDTQNREKEAYRLGERDFLIAMPFIGGAKAEDGQVILVDAFLKMRKELSRIQKTVFSNQSDPEWIKIREEGKVERREETDAIKLLEQYADRQGGVKVDKHGNLQPEGRNLYAGYSRMVNKLLFFVVKKYKNLRDVLSRRELTILQVADEIIQRTILEGVQTEMEYHQVYYCAKARIEAYAVMTGRPMPLDSEMHLLPPPGVKTFIQ
ncbi:MAG: Rha family transcriptional regulator [Burkholderiales bacterium]